MKFLKKVVVVLSFSIFNIYIFAIPPYNPVVGGEVFPSLYSPSILGGGLSVTGGVFNDGLPALLSINPSLSAGEENPIFDASYILSSPFRYFLGNITGLWASALARHQY